MTVLVSNIYTGAPRILSRTFYHSMCNYNPKIVAIPFPLILKPVFFLFSFFFFFFFFCIPAYKIKMIIFPLQGICEVDVYERPWEHFRSVTKNTCRTTKRQLGGLFGGWRPVQNQNDPIVQKAIAMVIDRVNAMSNNMYRMVESRILSLEQQVRQWAASSENVSLSMRKMRKFRSFCTCAKYAVPFPYIRTFCSIQWCC